MINMFRGPVSRTSQAFSTTGIQSICPDSAAISASRPRRRSRRHRPPSYRAAVLLATAHPEYVISAESLANTQKSAKTSVADRHRKYDKIATIVSIDGVRLPCVIRNGLRCVLARSTESRLLEPLLVSLPSRQPQLCRLSMWMNSYYVTPIELKALKAHCLAASLNDVITKDDVVVSLEDAMKLYDELRKRVVAMNAVSGGWLQMNNSIVPYVKSCEMHFMPLRIVQNAATLFNDVDDSSLPLAYLNENQCGYLNELCTSIGIDYSVDSSAPMIRLIDVVSLSKRPPFIGALPSNDPFGSAKAMEEEEAEEDSRAAQTRKLPLSCVDPKPYESPGMITARPSTTGTISRPPPLHRIPTRVLEPPSVQTQVPSPTDSSSALSLSLSTLAFNGTTISAFYLNHRYYVLLEAVSRTFFRNHSVEFFADSIEHWLRLPVTSLNAAQERSLADVYGLSINEYHSKKLILHDDLTRNFRHIETFLASQAIDSEQSDDVMGMECQSRDVSRKRSIGQALAAGSTRPRDQSAADVPETRRETKMVRSDVIELIEID